MPVELRRVVLELRDIISVKVSANDEVRGIHLSNETNRNRIKRRRLQFVGFLAVSFSKSPISTDDGFQRSSPRIKLPSYIKTQPFQRRSLKSPSDFVPSKYPTYQLVMASDSLGPMNLTSIIEASASTLISPLEAIAAFCHASMLATGFRFLGFGEEHNLGTASPQNVCLTS